MRKPNGRITLTLVVLFAASAFGSRYEVAIGNLDAATTAHIDGVLTTGLIVVISVAFVVWLAVDLVKHINDEFITLRRLVLWTVGIVAVAGGVLGGLIFTVTLLDAWHAMFEVGCLSVAAWGLYFLISNAVAAGVRRGRQ